MSTPLETVLAYHQATKHHYHAFARGPGFLDWATQPDPFRRYEGVPLLHLEGVPVGEEPGYEAALLGQIPAAPLDQDSVSQLFFDSLALSAWKQAGEAIWSLRVNPSSGNLHPTEAHLICGPIAGLCGTPMVAHYAPREHALEQRAQFGLDAWRSLTIELPPDSVLVGLSSIYWREAWKYGERAFRYCQHDVGHAMAALSVAAAGLGWQVTLLDDLGSDQLAAMMGLAALEGEEAERPDCLFAVHHGGTTCPRWTLPASPLRFFPSLPWQGQPNRLSSGHVEWPFIDYVATASWKPATTAAYGPTEPSAKAGRGSLVGDAQEPLSLRQIVRHRRSAVALDRHTYLPAERFYRMLGRLLPAAGRAPVSAVPWKPQVHLLLFVHRVRGLPAGLYLLLRDAEQEQPLRAALSEGYLWQRPEGCPEELPLFQLQQGDSRALVRQLSCYQDIASDGCFVACMLAEFARPLEQFGPWFYRRLFWECGVIGQALYLEAEAAGIRGTGIGCFFDDAVHQAVGLQGMAYQDLYHFTVGGPLEDHRLATLPAYPAVG